MHAYKKNRICNQRGFTLLELLIVIAIMAILSVILIIVINPAETLKKSRDAQRISDLNTLKTAIGIYTTSTTSPSLGPNCAAAGVISSARVSYSLPGSSMTGTPAGTAGPSQVLAANLTKVDGSGWIPIGFSTLTGGSPIASLPVDPINTTANTTATSTDLVYRYICNSDKTYELAATLESTTYTTGTTNKLTNAPYYQVGTNMTLFPTTGAHSVDY